MIQAEGRSCSDRFECSFSMTLLRGQAGAHRRPSGVQPPGDHHERHGRGVTGNKYSTDVGSTKSRIRTVCEGKGKCSYDGLGVGQPPRTQSARLYAHSL